MSFLNTIINKVKDQALHEALQERVDLIQHKIKFMEQVPVVCLDTNNNLNYALEGIIVDAGGIFYEFTEAAKVVIYMEKGTSMIELMGFVPPLLDEEWPAVAYNRIYLMNDEALGSEDPAVLVAVLEDIAEMLYPGYFVFGNEGIDWLSFKTQ